MDEYSNEPALPWWQFCALLGLLFGSMLIAGTLERELPQDHTVCEYPVDEATAMYIRGAREAMEGSE